MRNQYIYPQVASVGYRWNMLKRITLEVGVEPVAIGDSDGKTFVTFREPLNDVQLERLNILMADDPTLPPKKAGTRFIVKDVQNFQNEIEAEMGLMFLLYYTESQPGSGVVDQLELIFNKELTKAEEKRVMEAYAKLISRK